jgi:hypothetical protein
MEEDDFVFVDGDDAVSVSSSRSSLFLVEDPSTDALMLHGEEPSPLKKVASAPPPEDNEPAPKDALQSLSVVEGDPPVRDAPKEEVSVWQKEFCHNLARIIFSAKHGGIAQCLTPSSCGCQIVQTPGWSFEPAFCMGRLWTQVMWSCAGYLLTFVFLEC